VARIETTDDALAEDNEAVAWIDGADAVNVSVVSENGAALAPLLQQDPSLNVVFVKPAEYKPATGGIVIFDRWLPPAAPTQPALCIAPPASAWLGQPGAEERGARWVSPGTHAVIAGVDPLTIDVKRVRGYAGPELATLAASERGTPLVSVMDHPDRRVVVWSFSPADSNLSSAPAFPVLLGNTIEWLARPSYGVLRRSGPAELPASTAHVVFTGWPAGTGRQNRRPCGRSPVLARPLSRRSRRITRRHWRQRGRSRRVESVAIVTDERLDGACRGRWRRVAVLDVGRGAGVRARGGGVVDVAAAA
jgi:hypothetical protein